MTNLKICDFSQNNFMSSFFQRLVPLCRLRINAFQVARLWKEHKYLLEGIKRNGKFLFRLIGSVVHDSRSKVDVCFVVYIDAEFLSKEFYLIIMLCELTISKSFVDLKNYLIYFALCSPSVFRQSRRYAFYSQSCMHC